MPAAWDVRNWRQVGGARRGAGPRPAVRAVEGEQHSTPAGVLAAALRDFAHAR